MSKQTAGQAWVAKTYPGLNDCRAKARAKAYNAGVSDAKPTTCEWKLEKYPDEDYELYRTECLNEYNPDGIYLDEDDNKFCRFCGGVIKEIE